MEHFEKLRKAISGFGLSKDDRERVECLQQILSVEQQRDVSYDEAFEVGSQLLELIECLAGGRPIIRDEELKVNRRDKL